MTITPADRAEIDALPPQAQEVLWIRVRAAEAVQQRDPKVPMSREVGNQAKRLGVRPTAVNHWIAQTNKHGVTGLIEGRVHS